MTPERLTPEGVDALAAWIATLNAQPESHVAYAATEPNAVAEEIRELEPQGPKGFVVLREGGTVVAAMGVESDPELKRAWLWGPWAAPLDWDSAADRIFTAALGIVPDGIEEIEVAADLRNERLVAFADRHGFKSFTQGSSLMTITRLDAAPILALEPDPTVTPFDESWAEPFRELHEACFPDRYYEARQLRDLVDDRKTLFTVVEDGVLAGFAFAQAHPPPGEPILDFIGVAESMRGRGIGKRMLHAVVQWVFSFDDVTTLGLTVRTDNAAAAALYLSSGFTVIRVATGWRRPLRGS